MLLPGHFSLFPLRLLQHSGLPASTSLSDPSPTLTVEVAKNLPGQTPSRTPSSSRHTDTGPRAFPEAHWRAAEGCLRRMKEAETQSAKRGPR